jgi:hypothetical protein
MKDAASVRVGSTYADLARLFREDGGLTRVGKHRFVMIRCPFIKIDVEFEAKAVGADGTPLPTSKVTKVSKPYLERAFED